ncbi:MAG TPA: sigma-70 family RNA polymerase sigma factor [Terriglobales bacterium]|jgi:RNA polymerase sigma-70 factor (ECF subfamily)|nr:sigma-70 family RNA polymerase sigma factor [Terriglobales bacterium]
MTSDEALMLQFQGGSLAAFEELFARYRKPLYGFFGRRLNNRERAEDLTQETFLAVIRAASRYEPRASVRTYLFGIALKLLAAERRKFLTGSTSGQPAPEPKTGGTPECVLWVRQAMEKLDAPDREILMLREYEQLSYSDIAQLLRIPVNTVRSRLFRSRLALKSYLESEAKTNPALRAGAEQPHPGRRGVQ